MVKNYEALHLLLGLFFVTCNSVDVTQCALNTWKMQQCYWLQKQNKQKNIQKLKPTSFAQDFAFTCEGELSELVKIKPKQNNKQNILL